MAPPENDEGRPGQGAPVDRPLTKPADVAKVPRTTWDGHPSLSVGHDRYLARRRREPAAIDGTGVAVMEGELAELLGRATGPMTDAEAVAHALADRYGPTWCRRLALELLEGGRRAPRRAPHALGR